MTKRYISFAVITMLPLMANAIPQMPQWQVEMNQRAKELENLQRQNGADGEHIQKVGFPATYNDLSFSERLKHTTEDISKYKDLKTYRELDVKSAAEWCADGEHKNTIECMEYRCGVGGIESAKRDCITYRCSKPEYRKTHQTECELNDNCTSDSDSSYKCMNYKCHKTEEKDTNACIQWLCNNDTDYKQNNPGKCIVPDPDQLTNDPTVTDPEEIVFVI